MSGYCVYEPSEQESYWDEDDVEHETNRPAEGCGSFSCSKCGYEMLFDEDGSWFEPDPPYAPRFKYCPNCGRPVHAMELRDVKVGGGEAR